MKGKVNETGRQACMNVTKGRKLSIASTEGRRKDEEVVGPELLSTNCSSEQSVRVQVLLRSGRGRKGWKWKESQVVALIHCFLPSSDDVRARSQ